MSLQLASKPAGWRRPAWISLLIAAAAGSSLAFACATPFAAFAALAALTMSQRKGMALVALVWLANQAVGFGALHYPVTVSSVGWGFGLLAAALLACLAAGATAQRFDARGPLAYSLAFLAAFAAYEGALFAGAIFSGSGVDAFLVEIVARIFAINAAAFLVLLIVDRLSAATGLVPATLGKERALRSDRPSERGQRSSLR